MNPHALKILLIGILPVFASCATIQPQVNSFVTAKKYDKAATILGEDPRVYGRNNQLLYWLDRGLIYHLGGRYRDSIAAFARAERTADELYTRSLTSTAMTFVINDKWAPYRGEDFELVLIHLFQALNYAALGEIDEALVEARNVDGKLRQINSRYKPDQQNVYKEDAFVRFLMGVLYETSGTSFDYNDAFISYAKALETYRNDYVGNYGLEVPEILKENILTMSDFMGREEFQKYRDQFPDAEFVSLEDKEGLAEVYLIQYNGIGPIKIPQTLVVPVDGSHFMRFEIPDFRKRKAKIGYSELVASDGQEFRSPPTELAEDIASIAVTNLKNHQIRIVAKALLRPAGKYLLEKKQEENIRARHGSDWATAFNIFSNLFNLASEQADLRSWQTLPAQIRVTRMLLEPGEYRFTLENFAPNENFRNSDDLGTHNLGPGEKKFLIIRTN